MTATTRNVVTLDQEVRAIRPRRRVITSVYLYERDGDCVRSSLRPKWARKFKDKALRLDAERTIWYGRGVLSLARSRRYQRDLPKWKLHRLRMLGRAYIAVAKTIPE